MSAAPAPNPRWPALLFWLIMMGAIGSVFALVIQPPKGAPQPPVTAEPKPAHPLPETAEQKANREKFAADLAAVLADLRGDDLARRKAAFHTDRRLDWLLHPNNSHSNPERRAEGYRTVREQYRHPDPELRLLAVRFVRNTCFPGHNAEHLAPDELLPACERLFREESGVTQVEAALIHWKHSRSAVSGKVLTDVLGDRSCATAARVQAAQAGIHATTTKSISVKIKEPSTFTHFASADAVRPNGTPDLLKRILTDAREPDELRAAACHELRARALYATEFQGEFRDLIKGLLAGEAVPAPVQEAACAVCATHWLELALVGKRAGWNDSPDSFDGFVRAVKPLHALTAQLVLDRERPATVRLGALQSLDDTHFILREHHPAVLQWAGRALTDAEEPLSLRVAAAAYAPLATAADFAALVRAADEDTSPKRELRAALVRRLHTATHTGQTPPAEWATDDVLVRLVRISRALAPEQRNSDEPDLGQWYRSVLRARGAGAVAALRTGLTEEHAIYLHLDALIELGRTDRAATRPAIPEVADVLELKSKRCREWYAAREQVCEFLLLHGREAKAAIPGVGKWVQRKCDYPPGRERYLQVYTAIGGDPVPLLVGMLGDEDWEAKRFAARQLGVVGPPARAAAPALCDALRAALKANGEPDVVTTALAHLGPEVLPEIKKLTDDGAPEVQAAGAEVLGKMGPECRSTATPILRRLYRDVPDSRLQAAALKALDKVNPDEAFRLRQNQ